MLGAQVGTFFGGAAGSARHYLWFPINRIICSLAKQKCKLQAGIVGCRFLRPPCTAPTYAHPVGESINPEPLPAPCTLNQNSCSLLDCPCSIDDWQCPDPAAVQTAALFCPCSMDLHHCAGRRTAYDYFHEVLVLGLPCAVSPCAASPGVPAVAVLTR